MDVGLTGWPAILPEVDATSLLYRNPAVTNAYVQAPYGTYNYAVLGVTG
jgi:hypothetical protein